jgi:RNA polymerase sigma factor (TIGR02999 family)
MGGEITLLLGRLKAGDQSALNELAPLVHQELHRVAEYYLRHERPGHTLQPTALINEVYLQLIGTSHPDYEDRAHFFGIAAFRMRQILTAHARKRLAEKRGAGLEMVPFHPSLDFSAAKASTVVALDDALNALAAHDADQARMVELRFYSGMTADEIALITGNSVHRVRHRLRLALAWLHREVVNAGTSS